VTAVLIPLAAETEAVALAAEALAAGSVVAIPTDTVYGLAVDPWHPRAVKRLFALKERPLDVALPLLVGSDAQVADVAGRLEGVAEDLAGRYWPGPLTLVVPRRTGLTIDLGGPPGARKTVGIRWPDHSTVQGLCRATGPLAVTSANLHRAPPATSALEVLDAFGGSDELALILDGGACRGSPSTVVECRGLDATCLREGAIDWTEILGEAGGGSSPGPAR
jgi:L-threonylcarbamoyladenylate synthase